MATSKSSRISSRVPSIDDRFILFYMPIIVCIFLNRFKVEPESSETRESLFYCCSVFIIPYNGRARRLGLIIHFSYSL